MDVHDLSAVHPRAVIAPLIKVPVPEEIRGDAGKLLSLLENWQASLPELNPQFDLEELSEIDQALSTLILYLRRIEDIRDR